MQVYSSVPPPRAQVQDRHLWTSEFHPACHVHAHQATATARRQRNDMSSSHCHSSAPGGLTPIRGLTVAHQMVMARYFTESNKRYLPDKGSAWELGTVRSPLLGYHHWEVKWQDDKTSGECDTRSLLASWYNWNRNWLTNLGQKWVGRRTEAVTQFSTGLAARQPSVTFIISYLPHHHSTITHWSVNCTLNFVHSPRNRSKSEALEGS